MRFTSVALAAMAAGGVVAGNHNHARLHRERHAREAAVDKRNILLDAIDEVKILALGLISAGENALSGSSAQVWIGSDGDYTNEFSNESDEDVVLVIWGPSGSWVNANTPLVTMTVPSGTNKTVSFASGASGAWSVIYNETSLVNGQISETWGEYTFGDYGVVDVSREVNMSGHNMTIVGPTCVTDMETCVFVCKDGAETCWQEYELKNCDNGSQEGATYGEYDGAPSGGCGGMGSAANLKTYLH